MQNQAIALLRWTSGFLESDGGNYSCFIQADGMNSVNNTYTITLTANISTIAPPPLNCTDGSAECTNTSLNAVPHGAIIGGSVGVFALLFLIGFGLLIIILSVWYNHSKKKNKVKVTQMTVGRGY